MSFLAKDKDILYFCPRWGSENLSWPDLFAKAKDAGYDGIEWAISRGVQISEMEEVWDLAAEHHMGILPQHYDTKESAFGLHAHYFMEWFERILPFRPFKINSQTGKEFFSMPQNTQLIDFCCQFENKHGIPISHETHRGKFSFAAHITYTYLRRIRDLRLTLDISHWFNVAESLLFDQPKAVDLAIQRTDHIHARIGHAEGPQVPDPRMDDWQGALQVHLSCWDQVVDLKKQQQQQLTITTEFGPFPYMVNVPATDKPIADQWEVNLFMLNLLKERYSEAQ